LDTHPDGAVLERFRALRDDAQAVLAAAVVDLVARPGAGGVALCDAPSCGQLFLRGRPDQRWCGPGCGNRVRAARHHARSRSTR
jgi:predicted RNA-binding Zn ribbon-like protein